MKNYKFNWRYALGEISIVTVGILMAFGINMTSANWKTELAYKEYSLSLIEDLEQNLKSLDRIGEAQTRKISELNKVVTAIDSNTIDIKTVSKILFEQRKSPTFFPINGTFKSLVSQGDIELFSTNVKQELFNLHETVYDRTVYNGTLYDNIYLNIYDSEIRGLMDLRKQVIDTPQRLKEKEFLKNILFIIDEADSYLSLVTTCKAESKAMLRTLREQADK